MVVPLAARGRARRGDLIVVAADSELWPGEVTAVTRAGDVRLWRPACEVSGQPAGGGTAGRELLDSLGTGFGEGEGAFRTGGTGPGRAYLVPSGLVEVRGALATAAVHLRPGCAMPGMPYSSVDDLCSALRPHLRSSPVAEFLRRAALQREASILAAASALAAAQLGGGTSKDRAEAETAYRASLAACDAAYRRALARAARSAGPDRARRQDERGGQASGLDSAPPPRTRVPLGPGQELGP
jgi:hypothetical protein